MSDRWPSCSAPIVGTSPIVRPARRRARRAAGRHDPRCGRPGSRSSPAGHLPPASRRRARRTIRGGRAHAAANGSALAGDGVLVAARDRPGERPALHRRGPSSRPLSRTRGTKRLALQARRGGEPLAASASSVTRKFDATERRRVVERPSAVATRTAEPGRWRARARGRARAASTGDRGTGAGELPCPVAGVGHQRVQRETLSWAQALEPRGRPSSGRRSASRARARRGSPPAWAISRSGTHQEHDARTRPRRPVRTRARAGRGRQARRAPGPRASTGAPDDRAPMTAGAQGEGVSLNFSVQFPWLGYRAPPDEAGLAADWLGGAVRYYGADLLFPLYTAREAAPCAVCLQDRMAGQACPD